MRDLKIFTDNIEQKAVEQIELLLSQDAFKDSKIRIMPDVHAGSGCVIGFTGDLGNKVIPSVVGVDIGCGMLCADLGIVNIDYKKLDEFIRNNIPSGMSVNKKKVMDFDISRLYCHDKLKNYEWIENSVGTLGGGNHFIEVDVDDNGRKYLVIHSGSRNLGAQVANYYQDLANKVCNDKSNEQKKTIEKMIEEYRAQGKESYIQHELNKMKNSMKDKKGIIPYYLAYLEDKNREFYLHDMKICQEFAIRNRYTMAKRIAQYMGWDISNYFESVHNYISFEDNIVRKGAISAKRGEQVIIPINMRDGCIVGVGRGNEDWNNSAPHGAGRVMSRMQAKEIIDLSEYKKTMENIYTTSVTEDTKDEAPFAYKTMEEILEHIIPTVFVEKIIKPVYNFKAA